MKEKEILRRTTCCNFKENEFSETVTEEDRELYLFLCGGFAAK